MILSKKSKEYFFSDRTVQWYGLIPISSVLVFVYIFILFIFHIFVATSSFSIDIDDIQNPDRLEHLERLLDELYDEQLLAERVFLEPLFWGISRIQFFEIVNVFFPFPIYNLKLTGE